MRGGLVWQVPGVGYLSVNVGRAGRWGAATALLAGAIAVFSLRTSPEASRAAASRPKAQPRTGPSSFHLSGQETEASSPSTDAAAANTPAIAKASPRTFSVDWDSLPLEEHGQGMGAHISEFNRLFSAALKASLRECVAQLPENHERKNYNIELHVRPADDGLLIESAGMDPKEGADAYMRRCLISRVEGTRLDLRPDDELSGPHRLLYPIRF